MAKRGTLEHEKTIMLADALGIMEPFALGILEAFWHWVAKYKPTGDLRGVRPSLMARSIRYTADADALWQALIDCNLVDVDEKGVRVHDWSQHADDATHLRNARAGQMFADGTVPNLKRLPKDERPALEALFQQRASAQEAHDERSISTLPLPLPSPPLAPPLPEPEPEERTKAPSPPALAIACPGQPEAAPTAEASPSAPAEQPPPASTRTKGKGKAPPDPYEPEPELPAWIDPTIWADFRTMRAEEKKPLTPSSARAAITTLGRHRGDGHDPNRLLEKATLNRNQGFWPDESTKAPPPKRVWRPMTPEEQRASWYADDPQGQAEVCDDPEPTKTPCLN